MVKNLRSVYEIKVTLRGSKPPIWRRLRVFSDVTLSDLHDILQVAMGWTDSHLHQFAVGGKYFGVLDPHSFGELEDERSVRLHDVLKRNKQKMLYEYDFGDGWQHELLLERRLDARPGQECPSVAKAKRACPPEDCGGPYGYARLLSAVADPSNPEHEEALEWIGEDFDPESFDIEAANKILRAFSRTPKERG